MRRIALVLIAVGIGTVLAGGSLWLAASTSQSEARTRWEEEARVTGAGTEALTRLSFPAQGQSFFVMNGASKQSLLRGPARLAFSAPPGPTGNCVIVGHRDTHFRVLKDLHKDEHIVLEWRGQRFEYRIVMLAVIDAADRQFYRPGRRPVLTLVTCYPFSYLGRAPRRYVVRAELLESVNKSPTV